MKCEKCGATITSDDSYVYYGRTLCEDCYLDRMAAPKACDPWAVFLAKKETEKNPILTPIQEHILKLIKEKGPMTAEEMCKDLHISEEEFKIHFTTLRHMELVGASKTGNEIRYTTFEG